MRNRGAFTIAGLLVLFLALPALGQGNPTGKLSGRVTDAADGSPMPGVTVTVSSPNLQGERQTTTSANGDYLFPALPPGPYTVVFALEGMSDVRRELTINAAQSVPLDAQMSLAAIEEEIVVTGVQEELSTVSKSSPDGLWISCVWFATVSPHCPTVMIVTGSAMASAAPLSRTMSPSPEMVRRIETGLPSMAVSVPSSTVTAASPGASAGAAAGGLPRTCLCGRLPG